MKKFKSDELSEKINLGIRIGVARALAEHKREGRPIVVLKDGKIVKIPPEEIEVDEELLKDQE